MITCEKDPLQWAVSDDKVNVHRFEQEFQTVLIGILSNLKRLDEIVWIVCDIGLEWYKHWKAC